MIDAGARCAQSPTPSQAVGSIRSDRPRLLNGTRSPVKMSGHVMFEHVHGAGDHPHCPIRVVTRTPTGDLGAVPMQLGQLLRASLPHEQGAQRVSQGPQAVQTRT
ncbi:MAG: hypothetical protein QOD87_75, partial [Pseudonocardiales bacterium]|nr:hypothetical protein [Pseudonocardiales bacterium]